MLNHRKDSTVNQVQARLTCLVQRIKLRRLVLIRISAGYLIICRLSIHHFVFIDLPTHSFHSIYLSTKFYLPVCLVFIVSESNSIICFTQMPAISIVFREKLVFRLGMMQRMHGTVCSAHSVVLFSVHFFTMRYQSQFITSEYSKCLISNFTRGKERRKGELTVNSIVLPHKRRKSRGMGSGDVGPERLPNPWVSRSQQVSCDPLGSSNTPEIFRNNRNCSTTLRARVSMKSRKARQKNNHILIYTKQTNLTRS